MWTRIQQKIDLLRVVDADFRIFGARTHHYVNNECLSEVALSRFERNWSISLPEEYQEYLLRFANGGAGPAYGIHRLGFYGEPLDEYPWDSGDLVGDVTAPFRLADSWNLAEFWQTNEVGSASGEVIALATSSLARVGIALGATRGVQLGINPFTGEPVCDTAEQLITLAYFSAELMDGAIPIAFEGCNYRVWLVVTGRERGYVWRDRRSDYQGVFPVTSTGRARASFAEWYEDWLDASLLRLSPEPR